MLLAIDVGNSNIKSAFWDGSEWQTTISLPVVKALEFGLERFLEPYKDEPIEVIMCAGVVPHIGPSLKLACQEVLGQEPTFLSAGMSLGVHIAYTTPETLGMDRLANVLGALSLTPPPFIVVDVGTATKFEAVDRDSTYRGGAIMPGPYTMARALSDQTAQLNVVELKGRLETIGRNTEEALRSGVLLGHSCAVEGMVALFRRDLGNDSNIFLTGGAAKYVVPHLKVVVRKEPNLTLIGLKEAARRLDRIP